MTMGESKGEDRVGISFNPSDNLQVDNVKKLSAELIDLIEQTPRRNDEVNRLIALAQTAVEEGAMWAVKAVTKKDQK